jgi:hypothetical protein
VRSVSVFASPRERRSATSALLSPAGGVWCTPADGAAGAAAAGSAMPITPAFRSAPRCQSASFRGQPAGPNVTRMSQCGARHQGTAPEASSQARGTCACGQRTFACGAAAAGRGTWQAGDCGGGQPGRWATGHPRSDQFRTDGARLARPPRRPAALMPPRRPSFVLRNSRDGWQGALAPWALSGFDLGVFNRHQRRGRALLEGAGHAWNRCRR